MLVPPRIRRHSINVVSIAAARVALQTQLSSASNSHTASSAELGNLKTRVEDVEREKRDLVNIVSRLKEDCVQRDGTEIRFVVAFLYTHSSLEEISTLRTNLKQSRHEYQELESQVRELRSTENSSKVFELRLFPSVFMLTILRLLVQARLPLSATYLGQGRV